MIYVVEANGETLAAFSTEALAQEYADSRAANNKTDPSHCYRPFVRKLDVDTLTPEPLKPTVYAWVAREVRPNEYAITRAPMQQPGGSCTASCEYTDSFHTIVSYVSEEDVRKLVAQEVASQKAFQERGRAKVYLVWDNYWRDIFGVFSSEALAVQFAKRRDTEVREPWLEVWTMDGDRLYDKSRVLP